MNDSQNNTNFGLHAYHNLIMSLMHDLKNPLTVAMGNMQLLQLKSDKLDIREMRLIDNAVAALKNQLGILDNISDSVKIAVGTRAFQSEATNVDEIITREVNLLLIQEPSKTCIYNPQNQRLTANADKKLLNRVFHNVFEHVRLNTLRGAKILIKSSTDENAGKLELKSWMMARHYCLRILSQFSTCSANLT